LLALENQARCAHESSWQGCSFQALKALSRTRYQFRANLGNHRCRERLSSEERQPSNSHALSLLREVGLAPFGVLDSDCETPLQEGVHSVANVSLALRSLSQR
jgi:hypothetical protein